MLRRELFVENAFFQIVLRIEQQVNDHGAIHLNSDGSDVAHLGIVGDRTHRPLLLITDREGDLCIMRQQSAAPAPWPKCANRRQTVINRL